MPNVENNAAFPRLEQVGLNLAMSIQHRHGVQVGMGINIAGTQLLEDQILKRPLGSKSSKIDHDRNSRQSPGCHRALYGSPLWPVVVRCFNANDNGFVLHGCVRCSFGVHILEVLLDSSAAHAMTDDVQQGEDASLGPIYDSILEIVKVAPSRAARVDDRRHAGTKREPVWIDTMVARVSVAHPRAAISVHMNID